MVDGYDIVPRLTTRGLGHLLLSVKDLIDHSKDTKHRVLCCTDCTKPDVNPDTIQQRQIDTLLNLDVKRPGTVEDTDGGQNDTKRVTDSNKRKNKLKLRGQDFLFHLSKMFVSERNANNDSKAHKGDEDEEQAMMFIPGRIMHLEVEAVDNLKRYDSIDTSMFL